MRKTCAGGRENFRANEGERASRNSSPQQRPMRPQCFMLSCRHRYAVSRGFRESSHRATNARRAEHKFATKQSYKYVGFVAALLALAGGARTGSASDSNASCRGICKPNPCVCCAPFSRLRRFFCYFIDANRKSRSINISIVPGMWFCHYACICTHQGRRGAGSECY